MGTGRPENQSWVHLLRRAVQAGIVVSAAWTGLRFAAGLTLTSIEKYCPMGGMATGYSVATRSRFSCATGEFNVSLLLALFALALLARKSFCSWLCPVGTVSEWVGRGFALLRGKKGRMRSGTNLAILTPPKPVDGWLRWLRLPVLLAILYGTILTGELIFRPFCPYYVLFSFHGHDVEMWSYLLLGVFLLGIIVVPFLWCRYLCPLGGALWPLSRVSLLRIRRHEDTCIQCGKCDRACGQSIPVSQSSDVTSGECTLCLECMDSCPVPTALSVSSRGSKRRWPRWSVPAILGVLLLAGLAGGHLYALPSYAVDYPWKQQAETEKEVKFTVKGVRCVDTAKLASTVFEGMDGVIRFTAYASRNQVIVVYDPARISVPYLVTLLEGPVYMASVDEYVFSVYEVLEIDGEPVDGTPKQNQ